MLTQFLAQMQSLALRSTRVRRILWPCRWARPRRRFQHQRFNEAKNKSNQFFNPNEVDCSKPSSLTGSKSTKKPNQNALTSVKLQNSSSSLFSKKQTRRTGHVVFDILHAMVGQIFQYTFIADQMEAAAVPLYDYLVVHRFHLKHATTAPEKLDALKQKTGFRGSECDMLMDPDIFRAILDICFTGGNQEIKVDLMEALAAWDDLYAAIVEASLRFVFPLNYIFLLIFSI